MNSVVKKADEVYDAGTLKVTEAVGQISPKAIDAETAVKGATAVGVANDVFNPAEPIPSSNEIGKGLSFIKNTYEQATDDFEATDAFLNKIISDGNQTNE